MTVFAIVTTTEAAAERMDVAITHKLMPEQYHRVGTTWLVDTKLPTSRDVTEFLCGGSDINEFKIHSFIVMPVTSYFGLHNAITWEWLQSKGL